MPCNPLTDEHCEIIDRILTNAPIQLELARRCVDCGMPFQDYVDTIQQQLEMATRIKQHFFPERP